MQPSENCAVFKLFAGEFGHAAAGEGVEAYAAHGPVGAVVAVDGAEGLSENINDSI